MRARRLTLAHAGLALLATFGTTKLLHAEATAPSHDDQIVAQAVCSIMQHGHINRQRIDDLISQRVHKQFLQLFDPLKLYFTEGDIRDFARMENEHDNKTVRGDLSFPFMVYKRFLERVDQRSQWAVEFAKEDHDFNQSEDIVVDPKSTHYAANEQEAKDRWRRRVKFDLVSLMVDGKTEAEARERVEKRYKSLDKRWHELDGDELVEMYLTAMTNSFDPHSTYMSPRSLEDFNIAIQLSLEGIGALLQSEDGMTIVKEIVPGGAADKDGRLQPGDKIVGVAQGDNAEVVDVVDMKLRDVVKLIRGKAGSTVRLEVLPAKTEKREVYAMTRQKIELQDREAKGEVIEMPKGTDGVTHKIGVIKLPSFYAEEDLDGNDRTKKSATNDVRRILEDFKKQGVEGVVMDLRTNGGGLLSEAISLTGLFIDQGPVVQVKDYDGRINVYNDDDRGEAYSGPLVVLVSKFSASASEIFAGAIQDYKRGIVVGDSSTHGKGSVQRVVDLGRQFPGNLDLGAVKLTMQKFYRVNGQSTQNRGVVSDVVLPSPTDHEDFGESKLDYALSFDSIQRAPYRPLTDINSAMLDQIRHKSEDRQGNLKELQDLKTKKDKLTERRARKVLTFNEDSLKKEREELNEDDIEELAGEGDDGDKKKEKKFGEDPYTQEVLSIMADYLGLKSSGLTAR